MRRAFKAQGGLIVLIALLSGVASLLMLTGPIYMLNVYNRVISTHSHQALIVLSGIAVYLYVILGCLDYIRARLLARMAARFHSALPSRFLMTPPGPNRAPYHAADRLRMTIDSPASIALCDLPWAPVYFAGLFILHPWLGWLGITGIGAVVGLTTAGRMAAAQAERLTKREGHLTRDLANYTSQSLYDADLCNQWRRSDTRHIRLRLRAEDIAGLGMAFGKTLRLILQSGALGLGAYLVLMAQISPGAMLAASILMGRAISPIDGLLTHWSALRNAWRDWQMLCQIDMPPATSLPPPEQVRVDIRDVTHMPSKARKPALRQVSATLPQGQSVALLGATGAGKSTLLRLIAGIDRPSTGTIMVAGRPAHRVSQNASPLIAYLPQDIALRAGSLLENIVPSVETADPKAVHAALEWAGLGPWIAQLPEGIDSWIDHGGPGLSHGQRRQICLARVYYARPRILLLDDPFCASDRGLTTHLAALIQSRNAAQMITIIATQDPDIARLCDITLPINDGQLHGPLSPIQGKIA